MRHIGPTTCANRRSIPSMHKIISVPFLTLERLYPVHVHVNTCIGTGYCITCIVVLQVEIEFVNSCTYCHYCRSRACSLSRRERRSACCRRVLPTHGRQSGGGSAGEGRLHRVSLPRLEVQRSRREVCQDTVL